MAWARASGFLAGHQEPVLSIGYLFRNAVDGGGNDGPLHGHGLQGDHGESLQERGDDNDVHGGHHIPYVPTMPGQDEPVTNAQGLLPVSSKSCLSGPSPTRIKRACGMSLRSAGTDWRKSLNPFCQTRRPTVPMTNSPIRQGKRLSDPPPRCFQVFRAVMVGFNAVINFDDFLRGDAVTFNHGLFQNGRHHEEVIYEPFGETVQRPCRDASSRDLRRSPRQAWRRWICNGVRRERREARTGEEFRPSALAVNNVLCDGL